MQKDYLGTIYIGVSDDFQHGLYPIARCVKASTHDLATVEMIKLSEGVDMRNDGITIFQQESKKARKQESKKARKQESKKASKQESEKASKQVKVIGCMDNTMDNTFESANRVYGQDGCSPTINTCGGGGLQPKILEVKKMNAQSLRMVRTDEGKALWEAYENGEIHHGFNEYRTLEPRTDGVSNTITTIQKDNLICEQRLIPCSIDKVSDGEFTSCDDIGIKDIDKECASAITSRYYKGIDSHNANAVICCAMRGRNPDNPSDRSAGIPTEQRLELQEDNICNCLTSVQKDSLILEIKRQIDEKYHPFIYEIDGEYYLIRIRKLTPRETWRLMDFSDKDFKKAQAVNSNTQLYKQSGNSIVRAVLMAIFKKLIESED